MQGAGDMEHSADIENEEDVLTGTLMSSPEDGEVGRETTLANRC